MVSLWEVIKGNWKGCERSTNSSWLREAPGHSGKLGMKVKFLPKWLSRTFRGPTWATHLFSSLKLIFLMSINFFCSQEPCGKCCFFVLSLEGKMQNQLSIGVGDSVEKGQYCKQARICERKHTDLEGWINPCKRMENQETWVSIPVAEQAGWASDASHRLSPLLNCLLIKSLWSHSHLPDLSLNFDRVLPFL